jgi:hypothetical protein
VQMTVEVDLVEADLEGLSAAVAVTGRRWLG